MSEPTLVELIEEFDMLADQHAEALNCQSDNEDLIDNIYDHFIICRERLVKAIRRSKRDAVRHGDYVYTITTAGGGYYRIVKSEYLSPLLAADIDAERAAKESE